MFQVFCGIGIRGEKDDFSPQEMSVNYLTLYKDRLPASQRTFLSTGLKSDRSNPNI